MEEEILKVRMLGGFSMVYQEKTLVFRINYICLFDYLFISS